ncbi:hypothetical protein PR048_005678 [Dryococelus australis]|uniref:CCHC-type domain-containing protein n=1 Tax=Dryococelus australis TaxID=614101 RepID=A0ABQ9IA27_9NEOP|nr:hypothetical protein PR048_005678 [Dryococelus australis]
MECQWYGNCEYSNLNGTQLQQTWRVKLRQFRSLPAIGPDAANIFNTFSLSEAESKNLSVIKTKFGFAPKTNIMYERYLFNKITQAEGQPFDDFLTSVVNQEKKSEFRELYDSLLGDKIVVGVCSDTVREKLLVEEVLRFDKMVKIRRVSEITKLQVSAMRVDTLHSVHAMHISHKKILPKSQDTEFKTRRKCPKCGYNHPQRTCPAVGKECKKCGKVGHFSKVCRSKQVVIVNSRQQGRTPEHSSSETFFVSSIDIHHKELDWIEKLTLPNAGEVFDGIGCLKGFAYDIHLIDQPNLHIYPPRRVPYSIRDKVKEALDSMVQNYIIEPITEPIPAVPPMVVVNKNGKVRICIDPSDINKNFKRRHYPPQTIEEIAARLKGSKYFTLLDCTKGFWQFKVTNRTSQYLTFATPWGRYKCKRMPFELAPAPELNCSMDDILLHAESINELDAITETIMKKLAEADLTLNHSKCVFGQTQVKFLGQLQRLLGIINYSSKFIPRVAEHSGLLGKLLEKDVAWHWELEQENAFEDLKDSLKLPPLLRYFDHTKQVTISTINHRKQSSKKSSKNLSTIARQDFTGSSSKSFHTIPQSDTKGSELYIADTMSCDYHDIPEPDALAIYKVQVVIPMSVQRIAQLKDAIHTSTELSALCRFILEDWPDNLRKY